MIGLGPEGPGKLAGPGLGRGGLGKMGMPGGGPLKLGGAGALGNLRKELEKNVDKTPMPDFSNPKLQ